MRTPDVIASAIANTFRSKTRTLLTILAIFIGAFTLTITTGLGAGINNYIDTTVSQIGAADVMTVTHAADQSQSSAGNGPREYDPNQVSSGGGGGAFGRGASIDPITQDDLTTIAAIDGVVSVEPVKQVSVNYIQGASGTQYQISAGSTQPGVTVSLADGSQPDADTSESQVVIPETYVDALGFADNAAAIGQSVTFGLTDAAGDAQTVPATIVGISETGGLTGQTGASPNVALTNALFAAAQVGDPAGVEPTFGSATVTFDPDASTTATDDLKAALADAGFSATTIDDTLGAFTTVIDAIVLVLNAFAIIALLAAGFGIVNTLFMSVQERTREIGLMKAMGMGSGKVFGLFSYEATFIGFLGSLVGVGVGLLAGFGISATLARGLFGDLPGLTLFGFDPGSVIGIILLVMGIAFLAGTLPAARAARADPIQSLRYE